MRSPIYEKRKKEESGKNKSTYTYYNLAYTILLNRLARTLTHKFFYVMLLMIMMIALRLNFC